MKTVICQINSKYIHSSLAPWCLLAGIREYCKSGTEATVIEGTINEKPSDTLERILNEAPEIIGFCTYIWNLARVLELAEQIKKKLPDTHIILGGPEVSYNGIELLKSYPFIDFVLGGEGEESFPALVDALALKYDLENIYGLTYRSSGQVLSHSPRPLQKMPPSPFCKEYFDTLHGRIAYIETSRGCPFSCAFCLSGTCETGGVRFFPLERSKEEILKLAVSGARTVKFVDRTFNADRRRAIELFKFIIGNYGRLIPNGVTFHFEIAARLLDAKTLEVISRFPPGAAQFEVGIQSFNEKTLEAIGRREDLTQLEENTIKLISLGNVAVHTDLIAGLPFENYKSFGMGFDRAYAMKPQMLQLGFLKVLHGSRMESAEYLYPCSYDELPPYEVTETEWMSHGELSKLKQIEDLHERIYNSSRFLYTFDYLLGVSGMSAFVLYEWLSERMCYDEHISLDGFTESFYIAARSLEGISDAMLKEALMIDRMASNNEGRLPEFLRGRLSDAKRVLLHLHPELFEKGVRRSIGWSEAKGCAVYANYSHLPDPINRRYKVELVLDS